MKSPFNHLEGWLSIALCCAISSQLPLPTASAQNLPTRIDIVVVEGEGAINNVRQRVARDPVVRIEDENHRPVAGAAVVFTLPVSGPSGEFSNGAKTITVVTDNEGTAAAHGLKINDTPGKLQIYVTASYRGLRARGLINQTLQGGPAATASHGISGKWIAILAAVGAAAAGGAIAATHGGSSTPTSTPTTPAAPAPIGITPGSPTLSPPR